MKWEMVGGSPVPKKLAPELREIGFGRDLALASCDRSQGAIDFARSQGVSKSSQKELFACWTTFRNTGHCPCSSCNPANPPGQSTHERRNDGVAYGGPARMPLRYWQVGMDCTGGRAAADTACVRARARGWVATVTYPGDPREGHHINFRKEPILNVFKPLKKGSKGKRVARLTGWLEYLGYIDEKTGGFGDKVEAAVKKYQKDHSLQADGIAGLHTIKQLRVTVRHKKECRKEAMKLSGDRQEAALKKCNRRFGPEQ